MTCDHNKLKSDPVRWAAAPSVGVQDFGGVVEPLDLKNCPTCKSTLALPVGFHAVWSAFGKGLREVRR